MVTTSSFVRNSTHVCLSRTVSFPVSGRDMAIMQVWVEDPNIREDLAHAAIDPIFDAEDINPRNVPAVRKMAESALQSRVSITYL